MSGLYLTSTQAHSGKSAMSIGLGLLLKSQGVNVGYMKPLGTIPIEVGGRLVDEDANFVSRVLQLDDPGEMVSPALLTAEVLDNVLKGANLGIEEDIRRAYAWMDNAHDVLILEATGTISGGFALGLSAVRISEMLDAKAVHVLAYRPDMAIDNIIMVKTMMGDRLVGVIVNNVPPEGMDRVKGPFARFLERNDLKLFGALPTDKLLMAMTVRELAVMLDGEILCCYDRESDLVESYLVGAMNVDSALRYFMRVPNKAVITGGDRADIQLAALQTSTKALVLTGNLYPDTIILSRAAEVGVPIILARMDTLSVVNKVEQMMGHIRMSHPRQVSRLLELVSNNVNIEGLRQAAGI
ncbi:MAG: phosphotransacetylase family protein [Chloroflexota bacterium]